nr:MAG TPA: hypothetical protein [Caudoviricetes sp.]
MFESLKRRGYVADRKYEAGEFRGRKKTIQSTREKGKKPLTSL